MTCDLLTPLSSVLLGDSAAMHELRDRIAKVARRGVSVLLEGETGTGKELVARALHDMSGRHGQYVTLSLAEIPETLGELSLFGNMRGAFTGAASSTAGILAQAREGTLFLDELNSTPVPLQPKLLRFLDSGKYRRLGSGKEECSDARIVAAINEPLNDLQASGRLRPDLIHRLCGYRLVLPPLRDRRGDLGLLATHFLRNSEALSGRRAALTPEGMRRLASYHWPGNVRELRNVIDVAVLHASGDRLGSNEVGLALSMAVEAKMPTVLALAPEEVERLSLERALKDSGDDVKVAAALLRKGVATLYRDMARLGIATPRRRRRSAEESSRHPPYLELAAEVPSRQAGHHARLRRMPHSPDATA